MWVFLIYYQKEIKDFKDKNLDSLNLLDSDESGVYDEININDRIIKKQGTNEQIHCS